MSTKAALTAALLAAPICFNYTFAHLFLFCCLIVVHREHAVGCVMYLVGKELSARKNVQLYKEAIQIGRKGKNLRCLVRARLNTIAI